MFALYNTKAVKVKLRARCERHIIYTGGHPRITVISAAQVSKHLWTGFLLKLFLISSEPGMQGVRTRLVGLGNNSI